jgi:hypothetical protein
LEEFYRNWGGGSVTISDCRPSSLKKSKSSSIRKIILDNETLWSENFKNEKFDLIIHWGLLYHLYNWKQDLEQCVKLTDYICLETLVCDSFYHSKEKIIFEIGKDSGKSFIVKIPSQETIEKHLTNLGCVYERFDDKDLDLFLYPKDGYISKFIYNFLGLYKKNKEKKICSNLYSWKSTDNTSSFLKRRFWLIKTKN